MRRGPTMLALALLAGACRDRAAPAAAPRSAAPTAAGRARLDLGAWVASSASALGCRLEREYGWRDPAWACGAAPAPATDPCDDGWDAGPMVPDLVARRIHPRLAHVQVAWEHGALQAVTFVFDPDVAPAALAPLLGIGPGTLDAAAAFGPAACPAPCYRVVVFAPSEPCAEDDAPDEAP